MGSSNSSNSGSGHIAPMSASIRNARRPACSRFGWRNGPASRAVSAVWHPLGCLYIELLRDARISVRLHVWGIAAGRFSGSGLDVHAHDFDLRSCVLTGAIENELYAQQPGAATHRLYEIDYEREINLLRASGKLVRCETQSRDLMQAGDVYHIQAGQFHRIRQVGRAPVATFLIASRQEGMRSAVLGPINGRQTYRTVRNPCTAQELRTVIGDVLSRLWA